VRCRITKDKCKIILNLGKMPIANGFLKKKDFKKEFFFKLRVGFNKKISLLQLESNPSPEKMFNKNYPFYTSSSKNMVSHFNKFAYWIKKKILKKNRKILEIGSNDGTFLTNFKKYFHMGFEPSKSVHNVAIKNKIKSVNKFFNFQNIKFLIKKKIKFDLIVGSNVICHIPNQNELIKSMKSILEENGTIIFEEPYLGSMYKKISYDQIYDEHIFMFSATSINKIYKLHGLKLVDVLPQKTHGGSMRYVIKKNNNIKISKRLKKILADEKKKNVDTLKGCYIFKKKVENSKKKLIEKLKRMKKQNKKICGYGATSKSTTILNYCKIGPNIIDVIFDTTKDKINKYSPGMHIPIVNYKYFKRSNYKNIFLLAWNHKKEIMLKENAKKHLDWFTHL
tara:strand:+ start:1632 stop:2813 length:1182 start_codon:yes stop_codon:yes gene_type:complete